MFRRIVSLVIVFHFLLAYLYGQKTVDSIYRQISWPKDFSNEDVQHKESTLIYKTLNEYSPKTQVRLLNKLSWGSHRTNLDQSYEYALEAEQLSLKINDRIGYARALNLQAIVDDFRSNSEIAVEKNNTVFKIAQQTQDSFLLSIYYNDSGIDLMEKPDQISKAQEYLMKSVDYSEAVDTLGHVFSLQNLANLYNSIGNYEKANTYIEKSYKLIFSSSDSLLHSMGYQSLGYDMLNNDLIDSSLYYFEKAKLISENSKYFVNLSEIYSTIGSVYSYVGEIKNAETFLDAALQITEGQQINSYKPPLYTDLGWNYYSKSEYNNAIEKGLLAYELWDGTIDQRFATNLLIESYRAKEDYKNSLYYLEKQNKIDSTIMDTEQQSTIYKAEIDAVITKEKKLEEQRQEIKSQRQKNILGLLISALLLTSIVAFFLYKNSRLQSKSEKLLAEKNDLLHQQNNKLEKYIASNIQLEQYAFLASHDLKTPLRNISSFAGLIDKKESANLSSDGHKYLNYIQKNIKRMYSVIEDLLKYSKINSQELNVTSFDLNQLIDEIDQQLQNIVVPSNCYKINKILPHRIIGDRNKLKTLFNNLIDNAIKFRQANQKCIIEITVEEDLHFWNFVVEDNAIGIPEDYKNQIFGSFTKLHSFDEFEGTGIGLSMCERIVEQHGGQISVESEEGKGSKFNFSISKKL